MGLSRRGWVVASTLFALAQGARADAQTLAVDPSSSNEGSSFAARFGLEEGRVGLFSLDPDERNRAVDRLVTLGTPEAFSTLFEGLDVGSPLTRDPAGRLRLVRGLAKSVERDEVRAHLAKEMLDIGGRRDSSNLLTTLTRETAALALARQGDPVSLRILVGAAMLRGAAGDPARLALLAYPPRRAGALLLEEAETDGAAPPIVVAVGPAAKPKKPGEASKLPVKEPTPEPEDVDASDEPPPTRALNPAVLTLLGDLGDVRAVAAIRVELDRSDRAMRTSAALALAKLGDGHALEILRAWDTKGDPRVVLAAAEALSLLGDRAAAVPFISAALSNAEARGAALVLASDHPHASLCAPLKALSDLSQRDAVRRVMALAASGCTAEIVGSIDDPIIGSAVVTALAQSAEEQANKAIEDGVAAALGRAAKGSAMSSTDRQWVRADLVRAIAMGRVPDDLEAVLRASFESKSDADLELGALGLVALQLESAEDLLAKRKEDAAFFGIARGALLGTAEDREALLVQFDKLDPEAPTARDLAAGVGLLEGGASVPKKVLFRLADNGGALASLAAYALGRRCSQEDRDRMVALLGVGDASIRLGAALGLGDAPVAASASWLVDAYASEEEVSVRRGIVSSLARRTELQREGTLEVASLFDPDATVRSLARGGRTFRLLDFIGVEQGLAVVTRVGRSSDVSASEASASVAVTATLPSGLTLPFVTSADGSLVIPGAPFGRSTIRLASVKAPVLEAPAAPVPAHVPAPLPMPAAPE